MKDWNERWGRLGVLAGVLLAGLTAGCDVHSAGSSTGGALGGGGWGGAGGVEAGCSQGAAVVLSDFLSTQVAFVDSTGTTVSESVLSTASTSSDGLAFALSGDVALPSEPPASGQVVVLDRFGTNVVSWIDPRTGEVTDQLPVGTGFESNPQDYLEMDGEAFVSRWGQNAAPGGEAFDDGGDLLVIDLGRREIVDQIVLPAPGELPARPAGLARLDEGLVVTLDRVALDFSKTGEAMLLGVNPTSRTVSWQQRLEGHKACGRLETSPAGTRFALACSGGLTTDGEVEDLDQSAILLFERGADDELVFEGRLAAQDVAGEPLQSSLAFVDDEQVLVKTQTPFLGETHNRLLLVELDSGRTRTLIEAPPNAQGQGRGLVYGGLLCFSGCSDICLMADAAEGVLQRFDAARGELLEPRAVEQQVGLPPVDLAAR